MIRAPLLALPVALMSAAPAAALTPSELFTAWVTQASEFDIGILAERQSGDDGSVTLTGIRVVPPGSVPQPLFPPESPVQEIVLRPLADGGVLIDLGLPGSVTIPGGAEEMGDLLLRQAGLSITARDGADAIEYEVAADSLQFATLMPEGSANLSDVAGEIWGLTLRMPGDLGADRTAELALGLDGFAYVANIVDADWGMVSSQTGRTTGRLDLTAAVTLPEGATLDTLDQLDFVQALERGLAFRLEMATGTSVQEASFTGFPFSYRTTSSNEPGDGRFSLDRSGVSLAGGLGGGTVLFSSDDLPVPSVDVEYGPARAEMSFAFGPALGDLRYALSLDEVKIGDPAWDAVDPGRLLPRDPVSFEMDLGGRMAIDLADLEAGAGPGARSLLESLDLRSLAFKGFGVEAAATGSLSFPGGDVNQPPTGQAQATLTGADSLLSALQQMGWITEDDAFQARIMLAAFFGPARDLDRREASIELRADGSVVANGVALP